MYDFFETFQKAFDLVINRKILGEIIYSKKQMYVSQILREPKKLIGDLKKSGGGVLITQTSHLIYMILKFFGEYEKLSDFVKIFIVKKMKTMHTY